MRVKAPQSIQLVDGQSMLDEFLIQTGGWCLLVKMVYSADPWMNEKL